MLVLVCMVTLETYKLLFTKLRYHVKVSLTVGFSFAILPNMQLLLNVINPTFENYICLQLVNAKSKIKNKKNVKLIKR